MKYFFTSLLSVVVVVATLSLSISVAQESVVPSQSEATAVASDESTNYIEPIVQVGHSNSINHVVFTPDDRYILSSGYSESILWDVNTGKKLRSLPAEYTLSQDGKTVFLKNFNTDKKQIGSFQDLITGETQSVCWAEDAIAVQSACFGSEDHILVTGHGEWSSSKDPTVRLWDVATGKLLKELHGHSNRVSAVAVSPNDDIIASGDAKGTIIIWDITTGSIIHQYEHLNKEYPQISTLIFSPDGTELASTTVGSTFFLDVQSKKITRKLIGHFYGITYSPDGTTIFVASKREFLNAKTKETISTLPKRHTDTISALAFSSNGQWLATANYDQTVILWDAEKKTPLRQFGKPCSGSARYYMAISPDGRLIAAGTALGNLLLFDKQTAQLQWKADAHTADITSVIFTPDGKCIVTGSKDNTTKLWDAADGQIIEEFDEDGIEINAIAVSSDGRFLVSGGYREGSNDFIQIRDLKTGKKVRQLKREFLGYSDGLAFQPKSNMLASAGMSGVILWDVTTGKEIKQLTEESARSVTFSPDGQFLAVGLDGKYGSTEATSLVWDMSSFKQVFILKDMRTGTTDVDIKAVDFSKDGKTILSGNGAGSIYHWDAKTGKLLRKWTAGSTVYSLSADSDNSVLTSVPGDWVILWDLDTNFPIQCYTERFHNSTSVLALHEATGCLAAGENKGVIQIWNMNAGQLDRCLALQRYKINSLHFSKDGDRLWACAGLDSVIYWEMKNFGVERYNPIDVNGYSFPSPNENNFLVYSPDYEKNQLCLEIRDADWIKSRATQINLPKKGRIIVPYWKSDDVAIIEICNWDNNQNNDERADIKTIYVWDLNADTFTTTSKQQYDQERIKLCPSNCDEISVSLDCKALGKMVITENGLIIHATARGTTQVFDKETKKEICSLYSFNAGKDWLVITPEGLFDGTAGARQLVSYRVGKGLNVQPVEAFFQDFYYPGLLAEIWKGGRPKPSTTLKDQIPPSVVFKSPKNNSELETDKITIEVEIADQGGGIQEPSVTVNGIGQYVSESPVQDGKNLRWKFSLQLAKGANQIVVKSATADGQIACESQPLNVTYLGKAVESPSFYVLTIGVSDYSSGTMQSLPCAKPDAEVLAEALKRRGGEFYGNGKVFVETLTDSQATKVGIQKALADIAKKAKTEDVLLLSLAGHGVTIGKRYFFIPYEFKGANENQLADDAVRTQGIPGDELQDWVNAIAARKRIIIYDTCQSGAAITRSGMEQRIAMESFRKATGCFSIAAAGGSEAALELPDVGHGALTYALLAGLGEAPKGILKSRNAAGSDGTINVRDWLGFAQDQVPNLTKMSFGVEQPVQFVSGENNFPVISIKKK